MDPSLIGVINNWNEFVAIALSPVVPFAKTWFDSWEIDHESAPAANEFVCRLIVLPPCDSPMSQCLGFAAARRMLS
jgi:hypothetical protein